MKIRDYNSLQKRIEWFRNVFFLIMFLIDKLTSWRLIQQSSEYYLINSLSYFLVMWFQSVFILLVNFDLVLSENTRKGKYTEYKGEKMIGQVMNTSKIHSPFECGRLCLQNSCKGFNVINRTEEDSSILCEIIGDEQQINMEDDPQTDCYGELNWYYHSIILHNANIW